MLLRTTVGSYAGQIRDYSPGAAVAALRTGSAVRLDEPATVTPALARQTVTPPVVPITTGRRGNGVRPGQGHRR